MTVPKKLKNLLKNTALLTLTATLSLLITTGPALAEGGYTWIRYTDIGSDQHYWTSLASSADGTKLVATKTNNQGGFLYTSTDSGVSWTKNTSLNPTLWAGVSSSADGTKLAVVELESLVGERSNEIGYIYTSTDSGVTWTEQTTAGGDGGQYWSEVVSSADGSRLAALGEDDESGEAVLYTAFNPALIPTDPDPEDPPITTTTPHGRAS